MNKSCIDCGTKLLGHGKNILRCRKCNGLHRKGEFKHSQKTKLLISKNRKRNIEKKFCKVCGVEITRRNKSLLCQPHSKLADISGMEFNGVVAIKFICQNKSGYAIWRFKCSCGKEFEATASRVKSGRTRSCGCLNKHHCKELGKRQKGKNSPVWVSDRKKTSFYARKKIGMWKRNKYGSWAYFSKLYKLDKELTCEITGFKTNTTSDVHVHHIQSVSSHPDLCFVKSNLVVIKKEIHRLFHSMYGKCTSRTQWGEFISNSQFQKTA